ncbi:hypothetical protein FA95DRAFT_1606836 [Auriscalpium vulgare]|uniref:Uncharacterized protein n=1 Tax=Auriscalpium vulgare TaxID=40419 RepID=A0ACB8RQV7_9AGAM|nr:hypothetical protein FA95DRAFT_1606836 [Auriscalpium vulgare]
MFGGGAANPYDDIVVKTTDENLTSENWELILNLCDKVTDEGEQGARQVIAAVIKRMSHRNPNVQLYSLALVESLSKNCGKDLQHEIASRAFTQALEKLITDRATHEKVRRKSLGLIAMWTIEWKTDPTLSMMEECHNSLAAKKYNFDAPNEPPPPDVDDEVRRREEEELQRALEISVQDKGGRGQWGQYSLASSSGAGGSGSRAGYQSAAGPSAASSEPAGGSSASAQSTAYSTGYTPAPTTSAAPSQSSAPVAAAPAPAVQPAPSASMVPASPTPSVTSGATRVRALHTFEPSEPGELAFDKGDIIKVVDRGYKDWWRGQLKGRTGIFPVNYVEVLPEPTVNEMAAEAQQEAAVFAQAANVDKLLTMLHSLDPAKDNLADNEEIQELYRSSMALRPKIVKLIDKYSQKRAELMTMNESFVKARTIFDRMMEDSLARHSEYYSQASAPYQGRPDSRAQPPMPQAYGWNPAVYEQPGYNAYPAPAAAYVNVPDGATPRPQVQQQPSFGTDPNAAPYAHAPTPQQPAPPQQQPQTAYTQPYPVQQNNRTSYFPAQASQPELHASVPPEVIGQMQPQVQAAAQQPQQPQQQQQVQPQPQPQAHAQQQPAAQLPAGPPYPFDPALTYPDPNVQAWAQYYAQGGTDPTGAVYFFSVPGVSEHAAAPTSPGPTQSYGTPYGQEQPASSELAAWAGQQQQQRLSTSPTASPQSAHPGPAFVQAIQTQQQQIERQSSLPNPRSPTQGNAQLYPEAAPPGEAQYQGLQGQFAGLRVGEQPVPRGEQAPQGVGA